MDDAAEGYTDGFRLVTTIDGNLKNSKIVELVAKIRQNLGAPFDYLTTWLIFGLGRE